MGLYQLPLTLVLLLSLLGAVSSSREIPGLFGASVYLSGDVTVTENHQIEWNMGTTLLARHIPGNAPAYYSKCSGRCELFPNATLRMDRLVTTDDGGYSVSVKLDNTLYQVTVQLKVYRQLSAPSLTISVNNRPVAGSNISLQCNIGGQVVHTYYFFQNNKYVSCDLPHITCNQSSPLLSFQPITESDSGNYTCGIDNPVSINISAPLSVNVAVRVSQVTLKNNASSPVLAEKDSVSLSCSALGTDLSYNWSLDGRFLTPNPRYHFINNNSTLVISPVSRSDQGYFVCTVYNYLNSMTSNPLNLTWYPEGSLECSAAKLDQNLQLSCSWPGGYPSADIHMRYYNLSERGQDQLTTILPMRLGEQLSCTGAQWGSIRTCALDIDAPQSAGFINNSVIEGILGGTIILSLSLSRSSSKSSLSSTESILPAKFSWRWVTNSSILLPVDNMKVISNDFESYLIVSSLTKELGGQFICTAENILGSTDFNFVLNVIAEEGSPSCDALSPGAIAGIVIGAACFVMFVVVTIILIHKKTSSDTNGKGREENDPGFFPNLSPINIPRVDSFTGKNIQNKSDDEERAYEDIKVIPRPVCDHTDLPSDDKERAYEVPSIPPNIYKNLLKQRP
ncbi:carcinoembryonic antigen-related cell adhesion molecule 1-like [Spea bombifrons]|uniref:carcinoembryonic antigen-related cell adhesion molecule 1-like n=1 Tax=Spea bombifrons TaxID=233779 RepID=UPI00234A231F|nr:carcinoembryonic antigen-related cell adhesion molecule 1-like [Spea bombifrons]